MSMHIYYGAIAATILAVSVSRLWRGTKRSFDLDSNSKEQETLLSISWEPLTSELSRRIFDPEDSDFVARESSWRISLSFRTERTALALQWLLEVRRHVSGLMRAHRMTARSNPDLRPAGELKLGFEFLVFQGISRLLYLAIWLVGPLHAAKLVGYSLGLAGAVRKMTEDIVTGSTRVAADLLEKDSQTKNRTATVSD